ncbi:MAG: ATP-binding cassette domain-containing protein [Collinsella sp.]
MENQLVKGLQFDMPAGQIWGLVAPNGHGKTTLLNTLGEMLGHQCACQVLSVFMQKYASTVRK